ncbi:MAG: transglutaminase family protein, partial [Bifidobacteriaceae bacterium]|nr:transglutaminase family protein [Bifidobacteriaceae bacterium]
YWGTEVVAFDVLSPHTELTLSSSALVEVARELRLGERASWVQMRRQAASATRLAEQSLQTPRTEPVAEAVELARDLAATAPDPYAAATAICQAVRARIEYVVGVTTVGATAAEVWQKGSGVCQDITHVALGAIRAVGIPARYVSGYMHPEAEPQVGKTVVAESHAWIEWFSGSWVGFDPTNLQPIASRHILVARGRDYDDIAPIRGVYAGTGDTSTFVKVEITRE